MISFLKANCKVSYFLIVELWFSYVDVKTVAF